MQTKKYKKKIKPAKYSPFIKLTRDNSRITPVMPLMSENNNT